MLIVSLLMWDIILIEIHLLDGATLQSPIGKTEDFEHKYFLAYSLVIKTFLKDFIKILKLKSFNYIALYRSVDEPERSGVAFRHLVFCRNARSGAYCQISFVLSVPALICNGPKKIIQYFAEEEMRNF